MNFAEIYKEELKKIINDDNKLDFFRKLTQKYMHSKPELIKDVFGDLLLYAKENSLDKIKGWAYYYLGWYYIDVSQYYRAVSNFLISYETFESIGDKQGLIYACNGLTNVYCQMGQFKLANEWGLKGISLCEEIDDEEALVIILINTGINYIQMKSFFKAREIYNCIKIMDYELTNEQEISCKLALAEIEINSGDPNIALHNIEEAFDLEKKCGNNNSISEIYKLRGMAYVKLNEYDLAEEEFVKSYNFSNEQNYAFDKCSTMVEWSKLCILVGRYEKAVELLKDVINISKQMYINILLRDSTYILYEIYKKMNKYDESLKYLEEYVLIDDKLYNYEQNQLMAKMDIKNTKREADLYKLLYDKTELLSSIGQKIISNLDIDSIIDIINSEINKLFNTDCFGVAVYDSDNEEAIYHMLRSGNSEISKTLFNIKDENDISFISYCINNKADIIINNAEKEYDYYSVVCPKCFDSCQTEKSMIFTPLIIKDKVIGVMSIQSYMENAYDKNDLNTLKIIANYSAIAIENAISFKKIEYIATYDHMTGFLNRFEIIRLGQIIYEKYKDNELKFSVIMIDIDNFKLINDTYGHYYGDKAINQVTDTISKCIRASDYIGRYGGDEFLLICPGVDLGEALDVAERIRNSIYKEKYILDEDVIVNITISLGVYQFGKNDKSFIDGVKIADKYMYKAKRDNKNKVVSKLI